MVKGDTVIAVKDVTVKTSGVLVGEDAVISGNLTIDADNVEVKNVTVGGNAILTTAVQETINFDSVNIKGKLVTEEENQVANARLSGLVASTKMVAEKPKTKLKITFTNSVVAYVEIKKVDTTLSVVDATQISILKIESNGISVEADPEVILPNLNISKGVTQIELNASIAKVEIETNDDLKISGSGNFQSVEIKTDKTVELATTGTIATVATDTANVKLGDTVKVGTTTDTKGTEKKPEEVISNIEAVKEQVNVEIKQEEFIGYIAAKVIPVKDKFGYVTLSVLNIGNRTIKYRFVNSYSNNIPAIGSKAPADAIVYNEGYEFIAWYSKDLQVFAVNDQNEIIDNYKIQSFGTFTHPLAQVKVEKNKIIFQSAYAPLVRFNEFYFVNNDQFFMPENANQYTSKLDSTGVPVLEVALPANFKYDASKMSLFTYYINGTDKNGNNNSGLISWDTLGNYNYEQRLVNDLVALKNLVQKDPTTLKEGYYWIENLLEHYTTTYEEVYDEKGNFVDINRIPLLNTTLMDKYIEALKGAEFKSEEDLVSIVKAVNGNTENKELIELSNNLEAALEKIYKEDLYDYDYYDRLLDTVTKEDIDAAEKLINQLQEKLQNNRIQEMKNLVDQAKFIFAKLEQLRSIVPTLEKYDAIQHKEQFAEVLNSFARDIAIEPLMDQYAAKLVKVKTLTPTTIVQAIQDVNALENNQTIVKAYNDLVVTTNSLFVENYYEYDSIDRLAKGVTAEQVAAVEQMATNLGITTVIGDVAHKISEAKYILQQLENVTRLNEIAKQYLNATGQEQDELYYNLYNTIRDLVGEDFKEVLLDKYVTALAKVESSTLDVNVATIQAINTNVTNVQAVEAYNTAELAIKALFKENYQAIHNLDERLNKGVTKEQVEQAKTLVEALKINERVKQSLLNDVNNASQALKTIESIAKLQNLSAEYLTLADVEPKKEELFNQIRSIIGEVSYVYLSNGTFENLLVSELTEKYIEAFAKTPHTTIAQLHETLQAVNVANANVVNLNKKISNLFDNEKLALGTTIESLNELQLEVEKLGVKYSELEATILRAKYMYYEGVKRPDVLSSTIVSSSNEVIELTFTQAIDATNIQIELAGLQQGIDYEVLSISPINGNTGVTKLQINISKLKPLALTTVRLTDVQLAETNEVLELNDIPLVNWTQH